MCHRLKLLPYPLQMYTENIWLGKTSNSAVSEVMTIVSNSRAHNFERSWGIGGNDKMLSHLGKKDTAKNLVYLAWKNREERYDNLSDYKLFV